MCVNRDVTNVYIILCYIYINYPFILYYTKVTNILFFTVINFHVIKK